MNSIFFFLLLIILSGILYWMVNATYQAYNNWPEGFSATANFFRLSVLIYTLLFVAIAFLWTRSNWFIKPLEILGRYSFGIYLSHVFFLEYVGRWLKVFSLSTEGAFLIATVLVFIGSISLTVIATRIPGLAWLVGKPQALENKWHYKVAKL